MGSGRVLLVLAVLAAILVQPVTPAQTAPTQLCFCESAASKPANNASFAWLDGLPLLVVAVAAAAVSLAVFLLLRLMREDSGTATSGAVGGTSTSIEMNGAISPRR